MRDIKFRAIRKSKNPAKYIFTLQELVRGKVNLPDDYYWSEYTGLTDRDGKEIYEDDIIEEYNCVCGKLKEKAVLFKTGKIEWMPMGWVDCAYALLYNDNTSRNLQYDDEPHYKIIGNIYENPELLEKRA